MKTYIMYSVLALAVIGLGVGVVKMQKSSAPGVNDTTNETTGTGTTETKTSGTLAGKVTIGPNCPVEQVDKPCLPSPEAYTAREFLVLDSNQKQIVKFHADSSGNYSLSLPPGVYTVTSAKTGIGYMSRDLPKTVTIKTGETTTLNIDIDTGIR